MSSLAVFTFGTTTSIFVLVPIFVLKLSESGRSSFCILTLFVASARICCFKNRMMLWNCLRFSTKEAPKLVPLILPLMPSPLVGLTMFPNSFSANVSQGCPFSAVLSGEQSEQVLSESADPPTSSLFAAQVFKYVWHCAWEALWKPPSQQCVTAVVFLSPSSLVAPELILQQAVVA